MASSEKLAAVFYDLSAAARTELLLDESREVRKEPSISRLANSDYRPSHYYVHIMDLALLAVLALLAILWKEPGTPGEAFARSVTVVAVLLAFALFVMFKSPFFIVDSWKGPVKSLALFIAAASEILSTAIYCREELGWRGFSSQDVGRFAVVVFSMSVAMIALLVYAFFSVVARQGRMEVAGLVDEDGDLQEPPEVAEAARRGERPGALTELCGMLMQPCCSATSSVEAAVGSRYAKAMAAKRAEADVAKDQQAGQAQDGRGRSGSLVGSSKTPLSDLARASSRSILLQSAREGAAAGLQPSTRLQ